MLENLLALYQIDLRLALDFYEKQTIVDQDRIKKSLYNKTLRSEFGELKNAIDFISR